MKRKINVLYFSATGTTEKVVIEIARQIMESSHMQTINKINFTFPGLRKKAISFKAEDLVIVGVPVMAGRVPNILLKYLNTIKGNGALVVGVVVYGNRNYDDALIELKDILELNNFKVIAAGAFIGEHSFSETLAQNRPDEKDMAIVNFFAHQIYEKMTTEGDIQTIVVPGNKPYKDYLKIKDSNGNPVDIRKVVPKTNKNCISCMLCVAVCPMGSIDVKDVSKITGICIKCCACIKKCPTQAKYFDDEHYLRHKNELEVLFASRREPELYI